MSSGAGAPADPVRPRCHSSVTVTQMEGCGGSVRGTFPGFWRDVSPSPALRPHLRDTFRTPRQVLPTRVPNPLQKAAQLSTKYHGPGGCANRSLFSPLLEAVSPRSRGGQGLVPPEPLSTARGRPPAPRALTRSSLCASESFFDKDTSQIGSRPTQ